jgi:hypothetical protein
MHILRPLDKLASRLMAFRYCLLAPNKLLDACPATYSPNYHQGCARTTTTRSTHTKIFKNSTRLKFCIANSSDIFYQ